MSNFYGISGANNNFFSNMFGSSKAGNAGNNANSAGNILSDFASIKSGSYGKLLKAYYAKNPQAASGSSNKEDVSNTEAKALTAAKDNALDLKESLNALSKDSLYDKGNDEVLKKVKSFIKDYNSLVEGAEDIDNTSVLRSTLWMTNATSKNQNILDDIGISIKADNTLELDEDAFKKSNMTDIKSVFQGQSGFGASVSAKASSIAIYAARAASQANASYTFTGNYDYSLSAGSMFDSLF